MANDGSKREYAGRLVTNGWPVRIRTEGATIAAVETIADAGPGSLPWIGPGLVDLQINGFAGIDLNDDELSENDADRLIGALHRVGVTGFLPTIVTASPDDIERRLRRVCELRTQSKSWRQAVAGMHLEGPFISPESGPRGAHPATHVRAPNRELFRRWQEAAEGSIRIVTLSPEWPDAPAFIAWLRESGVIVAIGHTAADARQIQEAAAAGATLVTHFGNGVHPTLPRHPNYLWDQLAADELAVTLIADGFHLPDAVLKIAMRVKGKRAMLVSDSVALAGMPAGEYDSPIGEQVVLTDAGRLHLASDARLLAGSASPLLAGIAHLIGMGLATPADAWAMGSTRPAAFLSLPGSSGIEPGGPADFAIFDLIDQSVAVRRVIKAGEIVA